ncbi:MAG: response regulator [Asticcacaulis sp.]|nr:response regulator [Asticcacaulis sp.]
MSQPRRILIVEDNSDIAELLVLRLGIAGYDTCRAADAEAAAQALDVFRPDGILLDIGLPGRDGLSFLQSIKATANYKDIPVLMLTARQAAGDIQLALKLGARDYVAKPFDDRKLLFRIGRMLGDHVATPTPVQRTYIWNK